MNSSGVQIYYGDGHGKSSAALGYAIQAAGTGQSVFIIQFLKGRTTVEAEYMQRLEPEIKVFHFERTEKRFEDLSKAEQQEEKINLKNGVNFARKVLMTGECNLLILDELLGVVDNGILCMEELAALLDARTEDTRVIITGRTLPEELRSYADEIYQICTEK